MTDSGGQIHQDGRVTKAQNVVLGSVGTILVALLGWILIQIIAIRENMGEYIAESRAERRAYDDRLARNDLKDDRQDADIRDLQRDVNTMAGRNMRGGPHQSARQ